VATGDAWIRPGHTRETPPSRPGVLGQEPDFGVVRELQNQKPPTPTPRAEKHLALTHARQMIQRHLDSAAPQLAKQQPPLGERDGAAPFDLRVAERRALVVGRLGSTLDRLSGPGEFSEQRGFPAPGGAPEPEDQGTQIAACRPAIAKRMTASSAMTCMACPSLRAVYVNRAESSSGALCHECPTTRWRWAHGAAGHSMTKQPASKARS
jgi:hypothetical protein